MSLLLPYKVVLRGLADAVEVSIQDPEVMFSVLDEKTKAALASLAPEAKRRLQSALEALAVPSSARA